MVVGHGGRALPGNDLTWHVNAHKRESVNGTLICRDTIKRKQLAKKDNQKECILERQGKST